LGGSTQADGTTTFGAITAEKKRKKKAFTQTNHVYKIK
jgi:hypothetical protein